MQTVTIEDILSAHADALNQGLDHTAWFCEQYDDGDDQGQKQHLAELLHLARLLKQTLIPQTARPDFTTQLRTELTYPRAVPAPPETPHWVMGIAFLFSLLAGWLGWRYWRRTTTESHASAKETAFFSRKIA